MERLARFGDYVILETLGGDPAGECYRAGAVDRDRVKGFSHLRVLSPDLASDGAFGSALRKSVLIGSQFDHPNIVRADGVGNVGSDLFLSRDHVGGARLGELLARCKKEMYPLGADHAIFVVSSVLAALEHMHGKKIEGRRVTHAGLSSSVVAVSYEGDVKLVDWELHEALPPKVARQLLGPQIVHIAPEVRAGGECTPRANIYSVGTMLVEVLARRLPPAEIADPAAIASAMNLKSMLSPAGADKVKEILLRCLAAKPQDRYEDVREIRTALDELVAAEGVEVSHFNFALFMHSLFRVETEEEAEKLEVDRNLRLEHADVGERTMLAVEAEAAEAEEDMTVVSEHGFAAAAVAASAPPAAVEEDDEELIPQEFEDRTMLAPPVVVKAPPRVEAPPAATPPPPSPPPPPPLPPKPVVEVKSAPPPPRPVLPDLEEAPAPARRPAKAAAAPTEAGGKKLVVIGIVAFVLVVLGVGVFFLLTRKTDDIARPTAPSKGGITQPVGPIGTSPAPSPDTTPSAGPTAEPDTPEPAPTAPGTTPAVQATKPTPPPVVPTTPRETPAVPTPAATPSDADLMKQALAAATNEAKRLVGAGKPLDATKVLDGLVAQYPDLAGPVKPLRDEIKKKADDVAAASKAAADAKAAEEEKAQQAAIESAAGEVAGLLAAGKAADAKARLDASPDLAGSPRGAELRNQIESALAAPPPSSVQEGEVVDASSGGVTAPRLLKKADAKYPPMARRQRVSGSVTVSALVGIDGSVTDTKVLSAASSPSGNWGFQAAAEEAARACQFAPATKEGVKVKMWISIPFNFVGE